MLIMFNMAPFLGRKGVFCVFGWETCGCVNGRPAWFGDATGSERTWAYCVDGANRKLTGYVKCRFFPGNRL